MSNENKNLNDIVDAQVNAAVTPEEVVEAPAKVDNTKIAADLAAQHPERAQEIVRERLMKMSPEQIAAIRAAKADAARAQEEKELEEQRLREEEAAKKQLSPEQKARLVEQLSALTPEQLEAVKKNREAKRLRDERLEMIAQGVSIDKQAKAAKKSGKKRSISYESKQAFTGFMFVLPWFIGFLLFFAIPCFQSLKFSFSQVKVFENYACEWIGFDNYGDILLGGASFMQALTATLTDLLVNVPVVLIFSLFVAVLLNRKFVGRGLVRAIFFLPVIVTTGVVMSTFNSKNDAEAVLEGGINKGILFESADATGFLTELGLNETLTEYMTMIADRIFDVVWDSGIQILLFLAALQGISPSLYEASDVEGATAWETFWLITFPNVAPIILVNIVYTIIDTFSSMDNAVMKHIDTLIKSFTYGTAAAASWVFFLVVIVIIGAVFLIFKLITKED
ncbi:MAG: sugar ABC transporter permease [Clostridia bacterium]|nr:sugar ABC transporter permease [Clostridia bacterium]